jgi:hypothetical protein
MLEAITFPDELLKNNPVICVDGKIRTMLNLTEFFERLIFKQSTNIRNCDNEIEMERYLKIKDHID